MSVPSSAHCRLWVKKKECVRRMKMMRNVFHNRVHAQTLWSLSEIWLLMPEKKTKKKGEWENAMNNCEDANCSYLFERICFIRPAKVLCVWEWVNEREWMTKSGCVRVDGWVSGCEWMGESGWVSEWMGESGWVWFCEWGRVWFVCVWVSQWESESVWVSERERVCECVCEWVCLCVRESVCVCVCDSVSASPSDNNTWMGVARTL